MTKIFKYELRRMLLSKFFLALVLINSVFAWYTLTTETVLGVAFTAPFSPWSFGAYLSGVMPIANLTALFLLSNYYSKNAKQVAILTSATPVDPVKYMLIQSGVVVLGFLLLCIVAVGLSVYFYASLFGYTNFAVFILPAIVTVLPSFIFFMGLGHWAGNVRPWLLFALIPVSFALGSVQYPVVLDFFGGGYFSSFPLTLPVGADGEPAFVFSRVFLATRVVYTVVGGGLWVVGLRFARRKIG